MLTDFLSHFSYKKGDECLGKGHSKRFNFYIYQLFPRNLKKKKKKKILSTFLAFFFFSLVIVYWSTRTENKQLHKK